MVAAVEEFNFKSKAACCAVEIGLMASEVLLTFPRPTMSLLIPETIPVNVGDAIGALLFTTIVNAAAADSSAANAVAISPNVSNVPGAELIRLFMAVEIDEDTSESLAIADGISESGILPF